MATLYEIVGVARESDAEAIRNKILLERDLLLTLTRIPRRASDARARLAQLDEAEHILLKSEHRSKYDSKAYDETAEGSSHTPLTATTPKAVEVPRRFCVKCGAAAGTLAASCKECGAEFPRQEERLSSESDDLDDRAESLNAQSQSLASEDIAQPSHIQPESEDVRVDIPRKNGTPKGIWRTSAVLVTIAVLGLLAWYRWDGNRGLQSSAPILGTVVDGRPSPVSLLNPPVLRPSAVAKWDTQNIHGTVLIESAGKDARVQYPDGSQYMLSSKLNSPSGKPSIALSHKTGTLTITSSGFPLGQKDWQQWSIQLPIDQMRDINGDGWPEIVLEDYSGGAHCCTHIVVLSLRPKGPVCVFSEDVGSALVDFSHLTADSRMEIVTTHLAEYALGSFATGTYGIPVIYSPGADGVYRVNTRAFPRTLNLERETDLSELSSNSSELGPEQQDSIRVNVFFLDYLTDRKSDGYQWLEGIIPTGELSALGVLAKVEETLKATAPEVLNEPDWSSLRGTLGTNQDSASSTEVIGSTSVNAPGAATTSAEPRTAVLQVIQTWVQSFRNKDSEAHAACYSPTVETYFRMHNVPNDRILLYKRQAFSELLSIRRYDISQVYVSVPLNDRIFATFLKEWDTPTRSYAVYSGKETERLTFANFSGSWRIVAEEELKIIEVNRQPTESSALSIPEPPISAGDSTLATASRDQVGASPLPASREPEPGNPQSQVDSSDKQLDSKRDDSPRQEGAASFQGAAPSAINSSPTVGDKEHGQNQPYFYSHVILQNSCSKTTIHVALRYESAEGWITRGWFAARPFETKIVNAPSMSRNSVFYVYAKGRGLKWTGDKATTAYKADVVDEAFTYHDGQSVSGSSKRTVSMFGHEARENSSVRFSCGN